MGGPAVNRNFRFIENRPTGTFLVSSAEIVICGSVFAFLTVAIDIIIAAIVAAALLVTLMAWRRAEENRSNYAIVTLNRYVFNKYHYNGNHSDREFKPLGSGEGQ